MKTTINPLGKNLKSLGQYFTNSQVPSPKNGAFYNIDLIST